MHACVHAHANNAVVSLGYERKLNGVRLGGHITHSSSLTPMCDLFTNTPQSVMRSYRTAALVMAISNFRLVASLLFSVQPFWAAAAAAAEVEAGHGEARRGGRGGGDEAQTVAQESPSRSSDGGDGINNRSGGATPGLHFLEVRYDDQYSGNMPTQRRESNTNGCMPVGQPLVSTWHAAERMARQPRLQHAFGAARREL